jgi:hypothetical protein
MIAIAQQHDVYNRDAEREIARLRSRRAESGLSRREIGLGIAIMLLVVGIVVLFVEMK